MLVAFRADASAALGAGHVMRCLTLARELAGRGHRCLFLSAEAPGHLLGFLREQGQEAHVLPQLNSWEDDAARSRNLLQTLALRPDWLVVDHYGLDHRFETALRAQCGRILVIEDLSGRRHDCELLLNPAPLPAGHYDGCLPVAARVFIGPRFALLPAGFQPKPLTRDFADRPLRIFANFGAYDQTKTLLKIIATFRLLPAEIAAELFAVCGRDQALLHEAERLAADDPRVRILAFVEDMPALLRTCDVAVAAGGTSTYERMASGLPSLVLVTADNQLETARALAEQGAHLYLGLAAEQTRESLAVHLKLLLVNSSLRRALSAAGLALVDGNGARRVAAAMNPLPILRPVAPGDCDAVHAWRNHEQNRLVSFDSAPIPLSAHRDWFARTLANPARRLLIGENQGQAVGVVRLDLEGEAATVSIYLVPGRTAQGWGPALLEALKLWCRKEWPTVTQLHAEIQPGNRASLRAFESAGFVEAKRGYRLQLG